MSGINFCGQIEAKMKEIGVGQIASVVGRYYAMDRDDRWDRVEKAYRLLTEGVGNRVGTAVAGYQRYYDSPTQANQIGDEFIEPTVVTDNKGNPLPRISHGDTVIFYNFRGDRPRELCNAFCAPEFPFEAMGKDGTVREMGFERGEQLEIQFVVMSEYERGLPVEVAIPKPPKMHNILGAYASDMGLTQFRCAEHREIPSCHLFLQRLSGRTIRWGRSTDNSVPTRCINVRSETRNVGTSGDRRDAKSNSLGQIRPVHLELRQR